MKILIEIAPYVVISVFMILLFFGVYNNIKNTKKKTSRYFSNTLRKELEEEK